MSNTSALPSETTMAQPQSIDLDSFKPKVQEILQLSSDEGWSVVDALPDEDLVLVHYNDDADMGEVGGLRGVPVNIKTGAILATSFGYTPTATVDQLIVDEEGKLTITDSDGYAHRFDRETVKITKGFDGVLMRCIRYRGKFYQMTHRRLNPKRSRWGSTPTFPEMYVEANGPKEEELFDMSKPTSSTCYLFLICHPALFVGTRQKVQKPYVVLLGEHNIATMEPADQVAPGVKNFQTVSEISGTVEESFVHQPSNLNIEEANHHLKFGYYKEFPSADYRLGTGESVIVFATAEDGSVYDVVKVNSSSYDWRSTMRGNNPNITNRFYELLDSVYPDINTDDSWKKFSEQFVLFPLYDAKSIRDCHSKQGGILTLPVPQTEKSIYESKEARIHLLWLNYLISLPLYHQTRALELFKEFHEDRRAIVHWLRDIDYKSAKAKIDIEKSENYPRVKGIISAARKFASERMASGENYAKEGKYMNYRMLVGQTIRNFIGKEKGPSLYRLRREMKRGQVSAEQETE